MNTGNLKFSGLPFLSAPIAPMEIDEISDQTKEKVRAISGVIQNSNFVRQENKTKWGGDSDDELSTSEDEFPIFQRKGLIEAKSITISCEDIDGNIKNIKGSELIEIAHKVVREKYDEVINLACEYEKDLNGPVIGTPLVKNRVISIQEPKDWLMSLGGWKGMIPTKQIQNYFVFDLEGVNQKFVGAKIYNNELNFRIENNRIHITKNFRISSFLVTRAWVKKDSKFQEIPEGKTDLSYNQIIKAIEHIKESYGWSDSQLASLQLSALSTSFQYSYSYKQIMDFLNYLNGLMFGIEPSGLNAGLVTGLMTLDLIVDKVIDYKTAFTANSDGGVYPYATFGNNTNTYSAREDILLHKEKNRDSISMKEYRKNPSLSPVAIKEATLIKKWLKVNHVIFRGDVYYSQRGEIEKAINDLFRYYFSLCSTLPYSLKKFNEKSQNRMHS